MSRMPLKKNILSVYRKRSEAQRKLFLPPSHVAEVGFKLSPPDPEGHVLFPCRQ